LNAAALGCWHHQQDGKPRQAAHSALFSSGKPKLSGIAAETIRDRTGLLLQGACLGPLSMRPKVDPRRRIPQ